LDAAAIALPTSDCIHLYRTNGVTYNIDGKKGEGGVVEESTTSYFVQDDCFIVPSMCSMLIGPSNVFDVGISSVEDPIISVAELPTATSNDVGKVYYLTTASEDNAVGAYIGVSYLDGQTTKYRFDNYQRTGEKA
jgi:hypothetical protein